MIFFVGDEDGDAATERVKTLSVPWYVYCALKCSLSANTFHAKNIKKQQSVNHGITKQRNEVMKRLNEMTES